MVNAGPDSNASQFYITLRPDIDFLDGKYTLFGELAEGVEVLDRMNSAYCDKSNRPFRNIRIKHTHILDDPFEEEESGNAEEPASPPPVRDDRPEADDEIVDEDDMTIAEAERATVPPRPPRPCGSRTATVEVAAAGVLKCGPVDCAGCGGSEVASCCTRDGGRHSWYASPPATCPASEQACRELRTRRWLWPRATPLGGCDFSPCAQTRT